MEGKAARAPPPLTQATSTKSRRNKKNAKMNESSRKTPADNISNITQLPWREKHQNTKINVAFVPSMVINNSSVQPNPIPPVTVVPFPKPPVVLPTSRTETDFSLLGIQEMFLRQIAPLYAPQNPNFLSNRSNHPLLQNTTDSSCVPPNYQNLVQHENVQHHQNLQQYQNYQQYQNFLNHQNSKYHQNLQQHPILKYAVAEMIPRTTPCKSPKKNKTMKNNGGSKFERHWTIKQVEAGLKGGFLFEGYLRTNPKNHQHSYVSSTKSRDVQDIFIMGHKHRNRAMEGDIVVVKLLDESEKQEIIDLEQSRLDVSESANVDVEVLNTSNDSIEDVKKKQGKIVYIKQKVHPRTCIGHLKLMPDKSRQKALFCPRDVRVPRLNIPCTSWPDDFYLRNKDFQNTLFLARITDWDDTRFAKGTILTIIGESGSLYSETQAILAENDLDVVPFSPEMNKYFPKPDFVIPEEEITSREDCRNLCVFTIDPATARDLDDAVSCKKLENGNYEVGVHISDVSYFLQENTELDTKVSEKATTVYMVEKAYHMLPEELCLLCSLLPGVNKLAFSVFWEISPTGLILGNRFKRTVINSCCQLSYEQTQMVLDGKKLTPEQVSEVHGPWKLSDIEDTITILGGIAKIFRERRFESGALKIDQPKVSFTLNSLTGLPESFIVYESRQSHQLIEEFMLLANMTVAEKIYEEFPNLAFLRCHPPPSKYMMEDLMKSMKPLGIELDVSSAGAFHASLSKYTSQEYENRAMPIVLSMLCAKPMSRARYFCADGCDDEDFPHYALNVPLYTHFTSPIRRYADIIVHRLLAASLNYSAKPQWCVDRVKEIAANCNKQKYNAKRAGEKSVELYCLKYIEIFAPLVMEAVVVEVKRKFIEVVVFSLALNRRIYIDKISKASTCEFVKGENGAKMAKLNIKWKETADEPETEESVQIFSLVKVSLVKTNDVLKITTELVRSTTPVSM